MLPTLNRKRALFVMAKIDEILAWEQGKETSKLEATSYGRMQEEEKRLKEEVKRLLE